MATSGFEPLTARGDCTCVTKQTASADLALPAAASNMVVACLLKRCGEKCEREADVNVRVRAGGACRAVRLAPPVRTESTIHQLTSQLSSCVLVLLTRCWLCLQSTPQTQSANVTESSGEEEEAEEEAPALAEGAGSEEAAGEGQETAG